MWRAEIEANRGAFASLTVDDLPRLANGLLEFERTLLPNSGPLEEHDRQSRAASILATSLASALHGRGWTTPALPGEAVVLEYGSGDVLEPFETLQAMLEGRLDAAAWRERCESLGIAGRSLAA